MVIFIIICLKKININIKLLCKLLCLIFNHPEYSHKFCRNFWNKIFLLKK